MCLGRNTKVLVRWWPRATGPGLKCHPLKAKWATRLYPVGLAWLFRPVSPPGVRHMNFIYFLGFGTVGIRKKKMIQELLLSLNQAKKIKVHHHHIKVRKSSAFISMQHAWRLQGMMLRITKSKAFWIIILGLYTSSGWICSLMFIVELLGKGAMDEWIMWSPSHQWAPTFAPSIGK